MSSNHSSHRLLLTKTHDFCAAIAPVLTAVLIHGIAANSTTFTPVLAYLEKLAALKNVRFVTFDLLGWGQSETNETLNYNYAEQLAALHNSLAALKLTTPLALVGHSMGTLITTRYASTYPDAVQRLILISPPVYTKTDLKSTAFAEALRAFEDSVNAKNVASSPMAESRSFRQSMTNIVLDPQNYQTLANLATPTTLIWGVKDQLIASYNLPRLLKTNPHLTAVKTPSGHSVSEDKCAALAQVLTEVLPC